MGMFQLNGCVGVCPLYWGVGRRHRNVSIKWMCGCMSVIWGVGRRHGNVSIKWKCGCMSVILCGGEETQECFNLR